MESAILLKTGIQNPGLTDNDWNPVPGNPESTVWNPESKKIPSTFLAGRMEGGGGAWGVGVVVLSTLWNTNIFRDW